MHWKLPYSVGHFSLPDKPQPIVVPIPSPSHIPISTDHMMSMSRELPSSGDISATSKQLTSPQLSNRKLESAIPEIRETSSASQMTRHKNVTPDPMAENTPKPTSTSGNKASTVRPASKHSGKLRKPPTAPRNLEKKSKPKQHDHHASPALNNSLPPLRKPPSSKASTAPKGTNKTELVEVQPVESSECTDEYDTEDDFDQISSEQEEGPNFKESSVRVDQIPSAYGNKFKAHTTRKRDSNEVKDNRGESSVSSVASQKLSQVPNAGDTGSLGPVGKVSSLSELSDASESELEDPPLTAPTDAATVLNSVVSSKQLAPSNLQTKVTVPGKTDNDNQSFCSVSDMSRTEWEESLGVAHRQQEGVDEEVDEELEEVTDEEDTMFEETLHDYEGEVNVH